MNFLEQAEDLLPQLDQWNTDIRLFLAKELQPARFAVTY